MKMSLTPVTVTVRNDSEAAHGQVCCQWTRSAWDKTRPAGSMLQEGRSLSTGQRPRVTVPLPDGPGFTASFEDFACCWAFCARFSICCDAVTFLEG